MTDIVERLRGLAAERKARGSGAISTIDPNVTGWLEEAADEIERLRAEVEQWRESELMIEAADEIERLRAENKRLQAALIEAAEIVTS